MSEELTAEQIEELRGALLMLHEDLAKQLSSSKEGARPVDLDAPIGRVSRMDAIQQQSMRVANRSAALLRQRQVTAAIERCEEGEYGECQGCGEPVEYRRLKANPEAPFCLGCQSSREKPR